MHGHDLGLSAAENYRAFAGGAVGRSPLPLATNAVVPLCSATLTAVFAAAASVGEKTVSHWPRLMLQIAPGYSWATVEKACWNWAAGEELRPPKAAR
ncbi:MAG: hypothetical protein DLM62_14700 [Pseudonocardiales bacterium]|nr:MAG: hypothetical protein DLM62_14700 [Pseudonocardiales bacterium]